MEYFFWEVKSTRDGARGGQEIGGAPQGGRRALGSRGPLVRRLTLFFWRKKANFIRKSWAKDSPQSELRISGYKRNGARAESGNAETERDREIDPILEGLSPLPCHAPPMPWRPRTRGETLLPSREEVKEEEDEGPPSPLLFQWRRNAVVAIIIITAIYTNTSAIFTNNSITFPPLSTAVHSPATRCTLYLNMVLYASYYYPMMCCHPMMSE